MLMLFSIRGLTQKTYIPDDNFEQALINQGYDDFLDDSVTSSKIRWITILVIDGLEIQDLTGIEDFTALNTLQCFDNQLTSLGISANTVLTRLWCNSNQLTSLDVSANTALTELMCYNNHITSLDISANTVLTRLWCNVNQLTSLDVSANTALESLMCDDNQLTSLDVSANNTLNTLWCFSNQLTSLDVSANTALNILDCSDNQLTSLDVSANTALNTLQCFHNQLTSLDVSANTAINILDCSDNQLTSMDVRNGNNGNTNDFNSTDNPDLKCIFVDDKNASLLNYWIIDTNSTFVETEMECNALAIKNSMKETGNIIFPNPSFGNFTVDLGNTFSEIEVIVRNTLGQEITKELFYNSSIIQFSVKEGTGVYFFEVNADNQRYFNKVIIK